MFNFLQRLFGSSSSDKPSSSLYEQLEDRTLFDATAFAELAQQAVDLAVTVDHPQQHPPQIVEQQQQSGDQFLFVDTSVAGLRPWSKNF